MMMSYRQRLTTGASNLTLSIVQSNFHKLGMFSRMNPMHREGFSTRSNRPHMDSSWMSLESNSRFDETRTGLQIPAG